MSILSPGALAFLAVVPVIVLFYILRAQRNRQYFPSTRFWRELPNDLEGRPTWRLPLRNLLLLLQLLIAVLAVLALLRPVVFGEERRHVIYLLDASVSMQATDVRPSRFEEARGQIREMVRGLPPGDEATLVRVGRAPEILATGDDRQQLLAALDAAQVSAGSADFPSALALAGSLAERYRDWRNELVLVSDGAFPESALGRASGMPYSFNFIQVGRSDNNQAITELSVRPSLAMVGRYVAFVRIANYANRPVTVQFQARADGLPIESKPLQIGPQRTQDLPLTLPQGTKLLDVEIRGDDILRLDDRAQAIVATERARQVHVVSNNSQLWERAFQAVPLVKVSKTRPAQYKLTPADITVLDGFIPKELPPGNLLIVNPPSSHNGFIEVLGEDGRVQAVRAHHQHELLQATDLTALYVSKYRQLRLPESNQWADVLLESHEWPLILAGREGGRRVVMLAFDPANSELPQRIAFPVLVNNVANWLTPDAFATEVKPGSVLDFVPVSEAKELVVRMPNQRAQAIPVRDGRAVRFANTDLVGPYTVLHSSGNQILAQQTFIVNVTDELESDIRPRQHSVPTASGTADAGPIELTVEHSLWPWLAGLALVVLAFEWWYYCRRLAA